MAGRRRSPLRATVTVAQYMDGESPHLAVLQIVGTFGIRPSPSDQACRGYEAAAACTWW